MTSGLLAYHITFGTYGTRLHGDERGTVQREINNYGDPIVGRDGDWTRVEQRKLNFPPVVLTTDEQGAIEEIIPSTCERGGWTLHAAAAQPDHVHVLLTGEAEGKVIRRSLKTWVGQGLSKRFPQGIPRRGAGFCEPGRARSARLCAARPTWWAEGGSVKWIWDQSYFENVRAYVLRQRTVM